MTKPHIQYSLGFALPTVLIASIVMLIVLLAAIQAAVSVKVEIDNQYYSKLAQGGVDSGVAMAKACVSQYGSVTWTAIKPLMPGTNCNGDPITGLSCPAHTAAQPGTTDSRCYVLTQNNYRVVFTVVPVSTSGDIINLQVNGKFLQVRLSSAAVQTTSTTTKLAKLTIDKTVKVVGSGDASLCTVVYIDKAYCWGSNAYGQLGNNSTINSSVPVAVITTGVLVGKTIKSVSVGTTHACVFASDEIAYCWGNNASGQLGNNSTTNSSVPVMVYSSGVLYGKLIKSISLGGSSCVTASDDKAYCWGGNGFGQLGNNSTTNSSVPVAVTTTGVLSGKTVKVLSTGTNHACVIASDDKAYCWGYDASGQLGNNSTTNSSVPVAVTTTGVLSGKTVKSISSGADHTCVIASDDKAYCWGNNSSGQLGNNSTTNSSVPVTVTATGVLSGKTIKSISSGGTHTCVVASDNNTYCWGNNSSGQLGNNSTTNSSVPVTVTATGVLSGKTVKSASIGGAYSCVIASDNKAYCWGNNVSGQLGNGNSPTGSAVPVATTGVALLSSTLPY